MAQSDNLTKDERICRHCDHAGNNVTEDGTMTSTPEADFHAWLRTQFSTLEDAKRWVQRWYQNDQWIPGPDGPQWDRNRDHGGGFSMRAMAAHCSMALENKEYNDGTGVTWYMKTQYGPTLYQAMMDRPRCSHHKSGPPAARYILTMPCSWCGHGTTFSTNDQQHVLEILAHGRLCDDCYERQERRREKMESDL